MLASQRQDLILTRVRERGAVRVADLVTELDVSDMTVRRDIAELAGRGLVNRVHGGAVDARHTALEPGFGAKTGLATGAKRAIARAAVERIRPGAAIALSGGTTTHLIAVLIAADQSLRPLTVVTNSLPAADALAEADDPTLTVVLTGGTRTRSNALVGPVAVRTLQVLRVDIAFMGTHGIDPDAGLTTPNISEAETNRALLTGAGQVVVVADASKWGTVGLARVGRLVEIDTLITDAGLPADALAVLEEADVTPILVDPVDES